MKYAVARDIIHARNNAPDHTPLTTLEQVKALPRNEKIEIYCIHGWWENQALAGLIGLAAARGYVLTGRR